MTSVQEHLSTEVTIEEHLSAFRSTRTAIPELCGLSPTVLSAFPEAHKTRFSGLVSVRTDAHPSEYLAVPFVRLGWRIVRLLAGAEDVTSGTWSVSDADDSLRYVRGRSSCSISWALRRELEIDPALDAVDISSLIGCLTDAGLLRPTVRDRLSSRTRSLARFGSVGVFYETLSLSMLAADERCDEDGLPPLSIIRSYALYLLFAITRCRYVSAWELAGVLASLAEHLGVPSDPELWLPDRFVTASAIYARFIERVALQLGLLEPLDGPARRYDVRADSAARVSAASDSAVPAVHRRFGPAPLYRRLFRWQL